MTRSRGLRRYLPGAATLVALGFVWLGASALASHGGTATPSAQTGAQAVEQAAVSATAARPLFAGEVYVVRPGDTLHSIALRIDAADPRPVMALLSDQLHGGSLSPGERLTLP